MEQHENNKTCHKCGSEIPWSNSSHENGGIWECENGRCENYVCDKCRMEAERNCELVRDMDTVMCVECIEKLKSGIRTLDLEYKGIDSWHRHVFQNTESKRFYKTVHINTDIYPLELYTTSGHEGEPCAPLKKELVLNVVNPPQGVPTEEERNKYLLLGRLKSDCDYYLGYGNKDAEHCLWAKDEKAQISKMKELHNWFSADKKPDWLSFEDIEEYERQMVRVPINTIWSHELESWFYYSPSLVDSEKIESLFTHGYLEHESANLPQERLDQYIAFIDSKKSLSIIETRKPLGKFIAIHENAIVGIDNTEGHAWTEDFSTFENCVNWLNDTSMTRDQAEGKEENI